MDKASVRKTIAQALHRAGFEKSKFTEADDNIGIYCEAKNSKDDKGWFTSVLRTFQK